MTSLTAGPPSYDVRLSCIVSIHDAICRTRGYRQRVFRDVASPGGICVSRILAVESVTPEQASAGGLSRVLTDATWSIKARTRKKSTWLPRAPTELSSPRSVDIEYLLSRRSTMNGLIYLIGLIVVIMFILSFLGLR
jgi:hypothetical protein